MIGPKLTPVDFRIYGFQYLWKETVTSSVLCRASVCERLLTRLRCLEWPCINAILICNSGNDCEKEMDACQESPCSLNRECIDLSPKEEILLGRGYNCSACPPGYDEIDSSCIGKFFTILSYKNNQSDYSSISFVIFSDLLELS